MKAALHKKTSDLYIIFCPACDSPHALRGWEFNGDLEKPTFNPSILVTTPNKRCVCHSYVKDGKIQYLTDCTHSLKGQTVDLPDVAETWYT